MLNIITITKNDLEGLTRNIESTRQLRERSGISQVIIDSSGEPVSAQIKNLLGKEKNVKYFRQEPEGISAAFNFGIDNSEAGWLWFLNGGDCINPGLDHELFLRFLGISRADAIIFETADSKTGTVLEKNPPMWAIWPPVLSWIPHPSTIIKRELFSRYGKFDERYKIAMDYELWIRFFSKKITVDMASFVIAAFNREGLSSTSNKKIRKEVAKIIRRYFWTIVKKEFFSLRIILKALIINSGLINYKKDIVKPE